MFEAMYDYLVGMSFDEVVAELEARGVVYDFCEQSYESAREWAMGEGADLCIGGYWSDGEHFFVEFYHGVCDEVRFEDFDWD